MFAGYGETTFGAHQKLMEQFSTLTSLVPNHTSHYDLTDKSSFIDIGSGYGKVRQQTTGRTTKHACR